MEWIQSILQGDNGMAAQLVAIFVGLVILVLLLGWVFRRIAGTPARKAAKNRVPRLSITDVTAVDEKRYLVLARRDNVEHLILIGGSNDVVVETDIVRAQPAKGPQPRTNEPKQAPATTTKNAEKESEPVMPNVAAPVAAATAAVGAGIAATATAAANKADSAVSAITETSSDTVEAVKDTAVETFNSAKAAATETVESLIPEVAGQVEAPSADPEPQITMDTPPETVAETNEVNLEAEISEKLDDALSLDGLDLGAKETASEDSAADGEVEDDMQKLLKELADETKEPA